ncbi:hypothetical protein GOBAR_DD33552 [Gossypium barbadense]|nr:hypothetical protein GOBAR_DD33552 [Gossypium barbadense]
MEGRKFVRIAEVIMMVMMVVLSGILTTNPMMIALARRLNEEVVVVGGVVRDDHSPIPPIRSSCKSHIPSPTCPSYSSMHSDYDLVETKTLDLRK